MHVSPRLSVSLLFACTLLAACENSRTPAPVDRSADRALPDPMDVIYALPPEAQPYGLDVYGAHCASCHGALGQGVDGNPALRGLTAAAMMQRLQDYRAGTVAGRTGRRHDRGRGRSQRCGTCRGVALRRRMSGATPAAPRLFVS